MKIHSMRRIMVAAFAVLAAVLLALWTGAQPYFSAYAAEFTAYDKTTIEDDLRSVSTAQYPRDTSAMHRLLDESGFMEYGFSQSSFIAENYFGIYFYVYNPTEREISTRTGANVVNMAVEYDEQGEPTKYENCSLTYLDCTSNYRFYKFKLTNSADVYARALAYSKEHEGKRRYDIGSIQLWFVGDQKATDSFTGMNGQEAISYTYYCTGYAAGCGAEGSEGSTLLIEKKELNAISLEVKHTYFRPDKPNGKNYYTHDSLSSVYFAVPKKIVENYGAMSRIRGEYLKALTNDIFVTGNKDYFNLFEGYLGKSMGFAGDSNHPSFTTKEQRKGIGYASTVSFDLANSYKDTAQKMIAENRLRYIDTLHYLFLAENGNANTYNLSSQTLIDYMLEYTAANATEESDLVAGEYLSDLFDWVDDKITYFDIDDKDMTEPLIGKELTQDWFQSMNGDYSATTVETYRSQKAIYEVKKTDIVYTWSGRLDKESISKNLLIDESDVQEFVDYYEKYSDENVIYLIRFSTDEYDSCECYQFYWSEEWLQWFARLFGGNEEFAMDKEDTNCYWSQEYVYLNFEIIDLTFTNKKGSTVIPVVMSPIDIVGDITHPAYTTDDNPLRLIWWLVGIAGGSLALAIITEIAKKTEVRR